MSIASDADLKRACRGFIDHNRIGCPETIYQSDRVIENAYEFIEQICEIVGYHVDDDIDNNEEKDDG